PERTGPAAGCRGPPPLASTGVGDPRGREPIPRRADPVTGNRPPGGAGPADRPSSSRLHMLHKKMSRRNEWSMAPAPDGPAMRPHAPSCPARKCDVENGGAWAPTRGPSGQTFPDRELVAGRADPVTGLRPAGGAGSVGLPYSSYS